MKILARATFLALVLGLLWPGVYGAEKLKFGSPVSVYPPFYLPPLAAEDGGFWKQNGLEAEWVPFNSGKDLWRATVAGIIKAGNATAPSMIQSAAAGVPMAAVAEGGTSGYWRVWVLTGSPIKKPEDLKGAKIGVIGFGGAQHNYGRLLFKALGWEKDVRWVSLGGGVPGQVAGLKTGALDAMVTSVPSMIALIAKREIREVIAIDKYVPKKWVYEVVYAHRDFMRKDPDQTARIVKAMVQAMNFIATNSRWTIEKMKTESRYSEEGAKLLYAMMGFSRDGKLDGEALQNVLNNLIEYGIVTKEKVPPLEELYSRQFTG